MLRVPPGRGGDLFGLREGAIRAGGQAQGNRGGVARGDEGQGSGRGVLYEQLGAERQAATTQGVNAGVLELLVKTTAVATPRRRVRRCHAPRNIFGKIPGVARTCIVRRARYARRSWPPPRSTR